MTDHRAPATIPPNSPIPHFDACRTAARRYQEEFGWSCGASEQEAWIRLAHGSGAVAIDQPLAGRLRERLRAEGVTGPIMDCPGRPGYWVFLVTGPDVLDAGVRIALSAHGVTYRGGRRLIDLPPTESPFGPLAWIDPPRPGAPFPPLDTLAEALRALN